MSTTKSKQKASKATTKNRAIAKAPKRKPAAATVKKVATKASAKPAKAAKPAKEPKAATPSKKAQVLDLLRRDNGATHAEIAKLTGWQAHSVRGFVATAKKAGHNIISSKPDGGELTYLIK